MMETLKSRMWGTLTLLAVAGVCLPATASAELGDPNGLIEETTDVAKYNVGSAVGDVLVCGDYALSRDVFVYKDKVVGQSYSASVLYGLTTGAVRVAWNNQLPYTYEGVRVMLITPSWTSEFTTATGITGECGMSMGVPSGSFEVKVEFGGTNVVVKDTQSHSHSLTVGVSWGGKFHVSLTDLGVSEEYRFDVSGTWTVNTETSVTTESKMKVFDQSYSASATVEPTLIDPSIDLGIPPVPFVQ